MADDLSYAADQVRRNDRDRFLTTMFAPADVRDDHFTLLAFNIEIARTREVVTEPLLGEMRLQWWLDAVTEAHEGKRTPTSGNQVLDPLVDLIQRRRLPLGSFEQLIDGRRQDLDPDPLADTAAMIDYARRTGGALNGLLLASANVEPIEEDSRLATEAGSIWALTGRLRAVRYDARQGGIGLPADLFERHGVDPHDLYEGKSSPALAAGIAELVKVVEDRIADIRLRLASPKAVMRSVIFQISLAEMYLSRLRRLDFNVFDPRLEQGRALRQLRLSFRALRGVF